MKQYELIGNRSVEIQPNVKMLLEYFMVENQSIETGNTYYGVAVKKTEGDTVETEEVAGIFEQRKDIDELLNLIIEGTVTPISLVCIVDDYVTEKFCS